MILGKILYFLLIGWWFGGLVALAGYLLCASIIGLPIGVILLNRLPTFVWLKEPKEEWISEYDVHHAVNDIPFLLRVLWFFVVGWSLGLAVLGIGYIFLVTIIGFPIGIWLINRVPLLLTLSRKYD
jgi:uncharacterized membrane protein YccF (DUF307 family)